ncbi:hypothetical protein LJB95_00080 [Paludibacteraceae bacterium OttesenSCG-928-F17]|nr:hypothetical protein [Paludibacteraceae bacterium OttesenSCG-928-F17]
MDTKQIQNTYKTILRLLLAGKLKQAFDKTQLLTNEVQNGVFYDRFNNLQENYRYMLQYYVDGIDDPQRISVYNKLIAKLFSLVEEIRENLLLQNSTGFEYSNKRYFPFTRKYQDANSLYGKLLPLQQQISFLRENESEHAEEIDRLQMGYEALLPELFGIFWLRNKIQADEKAVFQEILSDDYSGKNEKALLVSAITMNLWRMFDEEKLMMLFDCVSSSDIQTKQRALVGLCFILAKYNQFLPYFPTIRNRLVLMADNESTFENFRNIITQIIATTETDKISKKLQEEILPQIMKMSPKLRNMDMEGFMNADEFDEANPQWEEIIEESGVSDKLQELSELQMEGADVYMSTFSMLKSFPFFTEFSNWFLPFDPNQSAVHELFKSDNKTMLSAFVNSHTMCDSDMYSFFLSVMQMPEKQRDMMKGSFKMESEQMQEMQKDEALFSPNVLAKNISKQYIQDLFRFFKLYPQRNDFENMFDSALTLHRTMLFDILSAGSELKTGIAEYYFSKQLYPQALDLFNDLLRTEEPTAAIYQKTGYAHQKQSNINDALEAYLKADIIQPDDLWTIKKIALCYRMQGNFEKALEYYKHAEFIEGEKPTTQMQIANCYLQMGKNKEALNIYFKLDAEDEENIRIQRAIAWAAFVAGNLPQGEYYIKKVLESENSISHDYLNAGHISFSLRKRKEALEYYRKSWEMMQRNWEAFNESFNEDIPHLKINGIDPKEVSLMLDELMYRASE